eukprot:TRINITY_DN170_c0_g1_i1.p1 TRINITY_DN170_c0_g1~~TRINITY_DN170_c0_g1_i1.p1  ORF type:complete len:1049 (-),score=200.83 TRINITY_DN170_c0_g1_i1:289-3435(-)
MPDASSSSSSSSSRSSSSSSSSSDSEASDSEAFELARQSSPVGAPVDEQPSSQPADSVTGDTPPTVASAATAPAAAPPTIAAAPPPAPPPAATPPLVKSGSSTSNSVPKRSVERPRPSIDAIRASMDARRSMDGRRSVEGRPSMEVLDKRPRPSMDLHARPSLDLRTREEFPLPQNVPIEEDDFVPSTGLSTSEATELLKQYGRNELEEKATPKWLVYLQQLYGPMPIMIWIAIIIEAGIQNFPDMGILIGIQFINATIGWYESTKAGDAVAALKASLKPSATCKRDGEWKVIDAATLVPGDLVQLNAGAAVPADCIVNEGRIEVDQAALTGESLPVTMVKGDSPKMGSNVTRGEVEASVQFTGKSTFFGRTASMLQTVNELGNLQKVLLRIMIVLIVLSITLCVVALIFLTVHKDVEFVHALGFVIVLLVASIPIAIEIVTTTTLAVGSRKLASMQAIVTRLVSIEEMAGMNMLCSDKTGTLTLNKMVIQPECPCAGPGLDRDQVLQMSALAAKWKEPPKDALDTMILGSADIKALDVYTQLDYMPFDPTIKRTEGTLRGPDDRVFKVTKGAPNIILNLCKNKEEIRAEVEAVILDLGKRGVRCLGVARTYVENEKELGWEMLGILTFLDPPRPDTKRTIERAVEYGVKVKMITGDHHVIAVETARVLGMGIKIEDSEGLPEMDADGKPPKDLGKIYGDRIEAADGFAHVYPEHKFLIVEALRQRGFKVGMTGDGVNDAPALKRADVGIAVSGATDAARAAADIVITSPGLSVVVEAIIIARCIFQRVKNFINYRVAATLQLLCFFFITVFAFPPDTFVQPPVTGGEQEWPVFFELPVLLLMLITLLNDGTLITIGYDSVRPSRTPEEWNLPMLFCVSSVLAAVACGSSLLLVWCALDSHAIGSVFHAFGLPPMRYSQIVMLMYLKVSISDFLTLFSARTRSFFWTEKPGWMLLVGGFTALSLSTILATTWPPTYIDNIFVIGLSREPDYTLWPLWCWIYCIVWWFIQDGLKVLTYETIYKFHLFGASKGTRMSKKEAKGEMELNEV